MKKKLLSITLLGLAAMTLFAQDIAVYQLTAKTPEDAKIVADSVAGLAKRDFARNRVTEYSKKTDSPIYALCYYNDIEKNDCELLVEFRISMIGANKDLEIAGDTFYYIQQMRGKFLDIFPIWKRYFNPNSVQEETVKKWKEEVVVNIPNSGFKYKFLLTNENDFWQIYGSSVWEKPSK